MLPMSLSYHNPNLNTRAKINARIHSSLENNTK